MTIITDKDINADKWARLANEESQHIIPAEDFWGSLITYATEGDTLNGAGLPWSKTHEVVRLRPGELSIWGGINGHGKSVLLGQVILWNLLEEPALIASMEMKPAQTMHRLACQAIGRRPSPEEIMDWLPKIQGTLFIYDQLDSVKADRILGMVHYAASQLKVSHIVIDSLTKCGITRDDYAAQTRFVDKLQWAAKRYNVHIHLVCHMRKGENEDKSPGKFDIRGAAEISDLADNVFVVHRNKGKEAAQKAEEFGAILPKAQQDKLKEPDSWLTLAKNRHGGVEDCWGLWFHPASQQFLGVSSAIPMPWPRPEQNVTPSPYTKEYA